MRRLKWNIFSNNIRLMQAFLIFGISLVVLLGVKERSFLDNYFLTSSKIDVKDHVETLNPTFGEVSYMPASSSKNSTVSFPLDLVSVFRCSDGCSHKNESNDIRNEIMEAKYRSLQSSSTNFEKLHLIVSSSCGVQIAKFLASKKYANRLRETIVYFVEDGLEMNTILLLPYQQYFEKYLVDFDLPENLLLLESKLWIEKLYLYPFYGFELPEAPKERGFVYFDSDFELNANSVQRISNALDSTKKLVVWQEYSEPVFEPLVTDELIEKYNLGFLFKTENAVHKKFIQPGVFPKSEDEIEWSNSKQRKKFKDWWKYYGSEYLKLPSFRKQTSISLDDLQKTRPVAMFGFRALEVYEALKDVSIGRDENFDSGKVLVEEYFRGPLSLLRSRMKSYRVEFLNRLSSHNVKESLRTLELLDLPIRSRHSTLYMNLLATYADRKHFSPQFDPNSRHFFFARTHLRGKRLDAYYKSWVRQMQKVGTPVIVNLVTKEDAIVKHYLDLQKKTSNKLSILLTQGSNSILKKFFPIEALEMLQTSQELIGGRFGKQTIGDHSFFSLNLTTSRLPWMFTQLTWMSTYASLLLDPSFRSSENKYCWFVDYDVMFTGDISKLVNLTDDVEADFMAPSQELHNRHKQEFIEDAEASETKNSWLWWPWGEVGVQYHDDIASTKECESISPELNSTARSRLRRSFATSFRLSSRMLEWVMESLLDPDKLFWPLDELLYRTTCELREECVYFSLNAIDTLKFDPNHEEYATVRENLPEFGPTITNFLSTFRNHRSRKSEPRFLDFVRLNITHNELWHPVKTQEVLDNEYSWLDLE